MSRAMVNGFSAPGFEAVTEQFEANLADRGELGGAFSAFVDGELVVDLWGGMADRGRNRSWEHDTIAGVFSGTKGLLACCLLLLLDRGELDLESPVCAYWPEFASHGKSRILVRHLVSHQAGLPGLTTAVTPQEATDGVRMATLLAGQRPLAPPGTSMYYHAVTFGWLCGGAVRRIDGRSVGHFFRDEVAQQLRLDAWIGLPAEHESRVALLERGPGFGTQKHNREATLEADPVAWSIWANPPRFSPGPLPANSRAWHAAEIPATNGIASARSLATLYSGLARGGEFGGVRLLASETVELGGRCLSEGVDPYLEERMAFGVGFELQTDLLPFGPAAVGFGHSGTGGSVHGAWPTLRTGFSYVTNLLCDYEGPDPRSAALLGSLYEAVRARAARAPALGR